MSSQEPPVKQNRRSGRDILQVAKRAGVSPATVSRVTNGRSTVDKKLAKRVWEAIQELGYTPNPQARALVSGRSRTLGLLISEITNPFFPELIQSFEDIAGAHDYEVMVGSTNYNLERARIFIRRLVQRRVEGVAVMTFRAESHLLDELIAEKIPLVSIDESTGAPNSRLLEIDYAHGINEAVQHLGILGHRRIGFASGPMPHLTNVRRKEAFELAAKRIGLGPKQASVCIDEHTFEGGTRAAVHFLGMDPRPTAIVCSNDLMAVGVLRVLSERRIAVPEQVSVIGFDDIHLAEFANPPLTTVRMSREDIARAAFQELVKLRERSVHGSDPIVIATRLVLRQSTASPADAPGLQIGKPSRAVAGARRRAKPNPGEPFLHEAKSTSV
jgi:LacI family transcriptional regulator